MSSATPLDEAEHAAAAPPPPPTDTVQPRASQDFAEPIVETSEESPLQMDNALAAEGSSIEEPIRDNVDLDASALTRKSVSFVSVSSGKSVASAGKSVTFVSAGGDASVEEVIPTNDVEEEVVERSAEVAAARVEDSGEPSESRDVLSELPMKKTAAQPRKTAAEEREIAAALEAYAPAASATGFLSPQRKKSEYAPYSRKSLMGGSKRFVKGDLVDIWSATGSKWFTDGVIEAVVGPGDGICIEGRQLPPGCAKIVYHNGTRGKWLLQEALEDRTVIKASIKPALIWGYMSKETHNVVSEWHVRYFELREGFLTWWITVDDCRAGVKAQGSLELVKLEVKRSEGSKSKLSIWTARSKEIAYNFDTNVTVDLKGGRHSVDDWLYAFKQHAHFANRARKFLATASQTGKATTHSTGKATTRKSIFG